MSEVHAFATKVSPATDEQLDPFTLGLLGNDEAIAIDQDPPAGRPA